MRMTLTFIGMLAVGEMAFGAPSERKPAVEPGLWYCIGPWKDTAFGIARTSFDTLFPPEQDVLRTGDGSVDLDKTYKTLGSPGMPDTERRWHRHPEWLDGYRHPLPRGPARSRNESVYLLRTIHAERETTLEAVYRSEDFVRVWLNGSVIAEHDCQEKLYGASRTASSFPFELMLRAGENRLLVKHTSTHNAHGFARQALWTMNPDGTMWLTTGVGALAGGGDDRRPFVCFNLKQACDLALIRIWNYNEGRQGTARGVKDLEIRVSTDAVQWRSLGQFVLDPAPGGRTWPMGPYACQDLFIAGRCDGVRYVYFDILTNHNGTDCRQGVFGNDHGLVGLSEVKFFHRTSEKR